MGALSPKLMKRIAHVLPAAVASGLLLAGCQSNAPDAQRLPRVQSQRVGMAPFSNSIETVSTLEAASEVQLAAQASGRILQLLVNQGDRVQRGQLLLVLDQAQLQAEVASLRGQMQTNKLNYERFNYLVKQGAASSLQRDEYRQAYIAAREALTARQADLAFKALRSPISGTVADLQVKAGDVIQSGSPLTKVIGESRLLARIDVPAIYAPQLRPGLTVELIDPIRNPPLEKGVVDSVDPGVPEDNFLDHHLEESVDHACFDPCLGQLSGRHPGIGEPVAPLGMGSEDEEDQVVIRSCVPRKPELTRM